MHFGLLGSYWWAFLLGMVLVLVVYVLVAGRGAEGGFRARTRHGWSRWQALSRAAADLLARIILTIFYFTLLVPFALGRKMIGDPLRLRPNKQPRQWLARQTADQTLDDARRQF
jgi:hypothetical protein